MWQRAGASASRRLLVGRHSGIDSTMASLTPAVAAGAATSLRSVWTGGARVRSAAPSWRQSARAAVPPAVAMGSAMVAWRSGVSAKPGRRAVHTGAPACEEDKKGSGASDDAASDADAAANEEENAKVQKKSKKKNWWDYELPHVSIEAAGITNVIDASGSFDHLDPENKKKLLRIIRQSQMPNSRLNNLYGLPEPEMLEEAGFTKEEFAAMMNDPTYQMSVADIEKQLAYVKHGAHTWDERAYKWRFWGPQPRDKMVPPARNGMTAEKFLEAIGRGASEYAEQFPEWKDIFTTTSARMKKNGIPPTMRKYLLRCREKYRCGMEPCELRPRKIRYNPKKYNNKQKFNNEVANKLRAERRRVRERLQAERDAAEAAEGAAA